MKLRAAMHTLDHEPNLVDWLGVIAHANQVRIFESLVGNVFRECVFVIQRDFERCDAGCFSTTNPCRRYS